MKYISVCSGIEACSMAWKELGWEALAFSEIEEFPRTVLQHYYPNVPLYGDFTELKDMDWIGNADLLVGGTPCQSFSIAGLRKSLTDDRGNLSLQFIRLANAIDNIRYDAGQEGTTILWENVPGVLSTEDNAFGTFLAGLCGSDTPINPTREGWSYSGVVHGPQRTAAWRVLDAQYFGLAQRRRRVFVLASSGARRWDCANALLPITQSMSWNPRPCREEGQTPTTTTRNITKDRSSKAIDTTGYQGDRLFDTNDAFGTLPSQGGNNGGGAGGLVAPTLKAGYNRCYNNPDQVVAQPNEVAGTLRARDRFGIGFDDESKLVANPNVIAPLDTDCGNQKLNHQSVKSHLIAVQNSQTRKGHCNGKGWNDDVMFTLDSQEPHTIAFNHDAGQFGAAPTKDHTPTLRAKPDQGTGLNDAKGIRRLTPKECERLQGFPDDFTKIQFKGKVAGDSVRYKALGNSMAVPVMNFIGRRIHKVWYEEK